MSYLHTKHYFKRRECNKTYRLKTDGMSLISAYLRTAISLIGKSDAWVFLQMLKIIMLMHV